MVEGENGGGYGPGQVTLFHSYSDVAAGHYDLLLLKEGQVLEKGMLVSFVQVLHEATLEDTPTPTPEPAVTPAPMTMATTTNAGTISCPSSASASTHSDAPKIAQKEKVVASASKAVGLTGAPSSSVLGHGQPAEGGATEDGQREGLPPKSSVMPGTAPPVYRKEGLSPGDGLSDGVDGAPPRSASPPRWEPVDSSASGSNSSSASEASSSREGQKGTGAGGEGDEGDSRSGNGGRGGDGDIGEMECCCERLPAREMHFPHQWSNARVQRSIQTIALDHIQVSAGQNGRWSCPFCGEVCTCDCRMLTHASMCGGQESPRANGAMPWTMATMGLSPSSERSFRKNIHFLQCVPCQSLVEWEGDNVDRHLRSCHLSFLKINPRARDIILTDARVRFTEMGLVVDPPMPLIVQENPPSLLSLSLMVDLEHSLFACLKCASFSQDLDSLITHLWGVPAVHNWGDIPEEERGRVIMDLENLWASRRSFPRQVSQPDWERCSGEEESSGEDEESDVFEEDDFDEEEDDECEEEEEGEDEEEDWGGPCKRGRKRSGRRRKESSGGKRKRGFLFLQAQNGVSAPIYGTLMSADQSMAHYETNPRREARAGRASFFQLPLEKTQLATTSLLHPHGIAVDLHAEVIVCIPCQSFLSFGGAAKHLNERGEFHPAYRMMNGGRQAFIEALGAFSSEMGGVNLQSDLLSIVQPKVLVSRLEDAVHEPFEGLPIEEGIMCRLCADAWKKKGMDEAQPVVSGDFIYQHYKSFKNNHMEKHKDAIEDPESPYYVAGAVNLQNGDGVVFEKVSYQTLTRDASFPQRHQPVKVRVLPSLHATILAVSGPALRGKLSMAARLAMRLSAGTEGASGGCKRGREEEDDRAFSAIHNKLRVVGWIMKNKPNLVRLKALTGIPGSWSMSKRPLERTETALVILLKVYLGDANERFDEVPQTTAELLNSVDLDKTKNTHRLRKYLQKTVTDYRSKATGLALQVLRQGLWSSVIQPTLASGWTEGAGAGDEGDLAAWDTFLKGLSSLTDAAIRASQDFHRAVEAHWAVPGASPDGLSTRALELVHPLLDAVFNRVISHKVPLMACPMQQFLLIDCYTEKGGFSNPASLTKVCSAFKFAAKAWAVTALYTVGTAPSRVVPYVQKKMKDSLQLESTPFWEMVSMGNLVQGATNGQAIIPTVVPLESDPTKMSYMVTMRGKSRQLDFNQHRCGIQAAIDEALRLFLCLYQGAPVEFLPAMQVAPFLARRIQNQLSEDDPSAFLEELRRCGVEPSSFTPRDCPYVVEDGSSSSCINGYFGTNTQNEEMMSMQSQIVVAIGEKSKEIRDTKTLGVASKNVGVDETKGWYHRDAAGNQVKIKGWQN